MFMPSRIGRARLPADFSTTGLRVPSRMGTHVRMGNAGHPYAVFQRMLDRGLKNDAVAAAAQLSGPIQLEPALILLVLLLDDRRYGKAAAKWHARCVLERRLSLPESHMLLGVLQALAGESRDAAATALAGIASGYGMKDAAGKLELMVAGRWPFRAPAAA